MKNKDNYETWLEELNNSLYEFKKAIFDEILNLFDFFKGKNKKG